MFDQELLTAEGLVAEMRNLGEIAVRLGHHHTQLIVKPATAALLHYHSRTVVLSSHTFALRYAYNAKL